jgi:hypothetical protein
MVGLRDLEVKDVHRRQSHGEAVAAHHNDGSLRADLLGARCRGACDWYYSIKQKSCK